VHISLARDLHYAAALAFQYLNLNAYQIGLAKIGEMIGAVVFAVALRQFKAKVHGIMLPNLINAFVAYPGCLLHSPYPSYLE